MRKPILFAALAAVAALVCALPAGAAPTFAEALEVIGTGTSVSCNTTPVNLDDTSVTNAVSRWVMFCNPNATVVNVGGTGVGANGMKVAQNQCIRIPVRANIIPQCHAASATSISVVEGY